MAQKQLNFKSEIVNMSFVTILNETAEHPVIMLKDNITGAEAEIYSFGALLNAFRVPVKQALQNIVAGFESVADAKLNITNGFKSAKLCPFVCRMNKGAYRFTDTPYQVQKHFLADHAIHGLIYDGVYRVARREEFVTYASVTLVYEYKGEDPGYPFNFETSVTWKLEEGNRLSVTTSITNQSLAPIPMADGWHPYFSLGGCVDDWTLQFSKSKQLVYDAGLIPTGEKTEDSRFLNGSLLAGIQLDNGFEWENPNEKNQCVISSPFLKLQIEPDASYPVLQVYTPPHRKSIAIENLSGAPDNFNNGMGLIILSPGETQTFETSYVVTVL